MDERISVFSNLKDDIWVKTNQFTRIPKDEYDLLIVPETGAWMALPKSDFYILDFLSKPRTIKELINYPVNRTGELIDDLFYSGLVRINDKDIFQIEQKKKENKSSVPLFWVLKYTNACNLRCAYCYSYDKNLYNRVIIPNEYIY